MKNKHYIVILGFLIFNVTLAQTSKNIAPALNQNLIAILDTIHIEDQKYRVQTKDIEEKHGWQSVEMKTHWRIIDKKDSINLIKVKNILNEYGWLGESLIGKQGNSTLFLVIQHSDLATQEKYLPMMREAVTNGNARPSSLALLEDRVAMKQGKKQIYGSQISQNPYTKEYYIYPLEDPDNVDFRREKVGLGKLKDYVSNWGIIWNSEEYKIKLPEYEEIEKSFYYY